MSDVQQRLTALDSMTAEGQILEALAEYYAESCTFTEAADGSSRDSRGQQHEFLSGFFGSLQGFNGATMHRSAIQGDLSFSEWTFDMTAGNGDSIIWNEVLVRRWENGLVVEEKFYNASA